MKLEDVKFCFTNTGMYLEETLKNGNVSSERRYVTDEEIENLIVYYGNQKLKVGESKSFGLSDGTKIVVSHLNGQSMKKIEKYVASDGMEFSNEKDCLSYEAYMDFITKRVNAHKDNPVEALISLMTEARDVLGIHIVSYDGYVDLFRSNKPCAYDCSLWKIFSDYEHCYPTLYKMYHEYMSKYIEIYGEKE